MAKVTTGNTSTRNDYSAFDRALRRMSRSLNVFSEKQIKQDILDLEPKDRLELYLKLSKFVVDNREFLKTTKMKETEGVVNINFFGEDDED